MTMTADLAVSQGSNRLESSPLADQLETISQVLRNAELAADFDETFLSKLESIQQTLVREFDSLYKIDPIKTKKAIARTIELREFIGRTDLPRRFHDVGQRVFNALPQVLPLVDVGRFLVDIRLSLAWAHQGFLRKRKLAEARAVVDVCVSLLESTAMRQASGTDRAAAVGLTGRALYLRALIYREQGELELCREAFGRGLEAYVAFFEERRKLTRGGGKPENSRAADPATDRWERVVRLRSIFILLGLAVAEYRPGGLRRARASINSARAMLMAGAHPLISAAVGLTYGSIVRCLAGPRRPDDLQISEDAMTRARDEFRRFNHLRQQMRAEYELALTRMYLSASAASRGLTEEASSWSQGAHQAMAAAKKIAENLKDEAWQCRCLIREARLTRELDGNPSIAQSYAALALKQAQSLSYPACVIEATIQLAFARIDEGQLTLAIEALESLRVLRLSDNEAAAAHLLWAQILARQGLKDKATDQLKEAKQRLQHVEVAHYADLAETIASEVEAATDTPVLPLKPGQPLHYKTYDRELRELLIHRAIKIRGPHRHEIADELKISRTTLNVWLAELGILTRQGSRLKPDLR